MERAPYAAADRVFWIVDNGSSHRGLPAAERLANRWPNLILVPLPIHARWLNQIEIVFSIPSAKRCDRTPSSRSLNWKTVSLRFKHAISRPPDRSSGNTRVQISVG